MKYIDLLLLQKLTVLYFYLQGTFFLKEHQHQGDYAPYQKKKKKKNLLSPCANPHVGFCMLSSRSPVNNRTHLHQSTVLYGSKLVSSIYRDLSRHVKERS